MDINDLAKGQPLFDVIYLLLQTVDDHDFIKKILHCSSRAVEGIIPGNLLHLVVIVTMIDTCRKVFAKRLDSPPASQS
jgi:hypothetical protein